MFAEKLLAQFKLLPAVKPVVVKWAEKMSEMLIFGLPKDQWSTEVYQLYRYCQRNKLPHFASFDPLGQFSAFMETWRAAMLSHHLRIKASITKAAQTFAPRSDTFDHNTHCERLDEYPSLAELLLDNLNLNHRCEADLQTLETNLIHQIKAGTKLEYSVAQVRSFCRSHAGEKGFYDERGRLNYLVGIWYDIIAESCLPISPVNLQLDDDNTFDELMSDIQSYVSLEA